MWFASYDIFWVGREKTQNEWTNGKVRVRTRVRANNSRTCIYWCNGVNKIKCNKKKKKPKTFTNINQQVVNVAVESSFQLSIDGIIFPVSVWFFHFSSFIRLVFILHPIVIFTEYTYICEIYLYLYEYKNVHHASAATNGYVAAYFLFTIIR